MKAEIADAAAPSPAPSPAEAAIGPAADQSAAASAGGPVVDPKECAVHSIGEVFKALSNEHRLSIMGWLMNPLESFPAQSNGDPLREGICVTAITAKTGLTQPSVTNHMHILQQAGLVSASRRRNWVFYRPNHARFQEVIEALKMLAAKAAQP